MDIITTITTIYFGIQFAHACMEMKKHYKQRKTITQ